MPAQVEDVLFEGRVKRTPLPLLSPGPEAALVPVKRLALSQGELCQLFTSNGSLEGLRYLAAIEFRAGQPRGNHYHLLKNEWVYVITGSVELAVRDRQSSVLARLELKAGDLVYIAPEVEHLLTPATDGWGLEFSSSAFDPKDTYRAGIAG